MAYEIEIPDLNDLEFERSCSDCYGTGKRVSYQDQPYQTKTGKTRHRNVAIIKDSCERCNNTGYQATAVGTKLLEFLRRHKCLD